MSRPQVCMPGVSGRQPFGREWLSPSVSGKALSCDYPRSTGRSCYQCYGHGRRFYITLARLPLGRSFVLNFVTRSLVTEIRLLLLSSFSIPTDDIIVRDYHYTLSTSSRRVTSNHDYSSFYLSYTSDLRPQPFSNLYACCPTSTAYASCESP